MLFTKRTLVPLTLALALLLGGCSGGKKAAADAAPTATAQATLREYRNEAEGISFSYPVGWTVKEEGSVITITSVAGLDCGAAIVDITGQVELFLAGHGDFTASVEALMQKNAQLFAGESALEGYTPKVETAQDGSAAGAAAFSYQSEGKTYDCQLGVTQFGGRVLLDVFGRQQGDQRAAQLDAMYASILSSIRLTGTEGTLAPADLSELGLPEAPDGCFRYYNPITGQFLIVPDGFDVLSGPYDSQVALNCSDYGLLVTGNWTQKFNALYQSNGGDLKGCYASYLNECMEIVEKALGKQLIYRDLKYQAESNHGELIKAAFYIDSDGTAVRCFAELATRGSENQYVQGTFTVANPDNGEAARQAFNVVMDNSQITFPLS